MIIPPQLASALAAALILGGCAGFDRPDNLAPVNAGGGYQAQWRDPDVRRADASFLRSAEINAQRCLPFGQGDDGKASGVIARSLAGVRLSRGDLLDIRVGEDETFTAAYEVSRDGTLRLPFLAAIPAQGQVPDRIEDAIADALLADGFYDDRPRISVRLMDLASVSVGVTGAVFEPHQVEIGGVGGIDRDQLRQVALGASTEARNLSAAIRAAGGIRPDADLSSVELRRGGRLYRIDMRGVFQGSDIVDVMLVSGDEIRVPSRRCFQEDLMRPGPVSPPGVSLFLSNLTQPATHNAGSAVGREVRAVPWGTRYLQAVIDTNCVGGPRATSADRSAVLFSRDPVTGVSAVIERDIEDLLRRADRDDFDPYLMPGDAIACYDSAITNLGEVGRILGLMGAFVLLD
ncbi:MAG: polysaccharide biosynthesis/export family protein [Rhodobacteraceae bacterium]|nr:polysaccharide biosynthesis/export family protein [Paracoccaceae bacterium]